MMGSYRWFTVLGIPIRVHLTLLLFAPFFAMDLGRLFPVHSLGWGLLSVVGLFGSVALHELGHSVVAQAFGYRVREIVLLPIGGVAQLSRAPDQPREELLIAAAGPLVSLLLALVCWPLPALAARVGAFPAATWFGLMSVLNLVLALFNLIPCFPMDGGRIFRALMAPRVGRLEATRRAVKLGRWLAVAFGLWGLYHGRWFLVLIAVFVYLAAGAEYRMVFFQESTRSAQTLFDFLNPPRRSGGWSEPDITVGPPPYRRNPWQVFWRGARARQQELFDDLFRRWR
jgi:Zn-dependent protease